MGDDGVRIVRADSSTPLQVPVQSNVELALAGGGEQLTLTGYGYWCEDGLTSSSLCRSMERVGIRLPR